MNDVILVKRPAISGKNKCPGQGNKEMWFLTRWIIYLLVLAMIGLVAYTYLGPVFGADFSPPGEEIRLPVILSAD